MIGHGLHHLRRQARHEATGPAWDRWIATGFAVGSACFFVGPLPGFVQLVGSGADAAVFFAGSIFFTLAAGLELWQATRTGGVGRVRDASWWSASIQFAGTLWFNIDTFDALQTGLSTEKENRLVWAPDFIGSGCFLLSGLLAYRVSTGPRLLPMRRDREWKMAAVNLAGCVFFGISAVASVVVPSTGSILDLAAANWNTALGALCFFIGALLLLPPRQAEAREPAAHPPVPKEA